MTFFELKFYSDFDMPNTDSVWIHDLDNIKPDLSNFNLEKDPEKAYSYLKCLGFKKIKTIEGFVGGDL